mmetsp:Transcript_18130/g.51732  ORF Transcript_18130/g.51732 Transcript_18130/m.51732 type:complete len:243 (-) Transcript_18130:1003-1731(-)
MACDTPAQPPSGAASPSPGVTSCVTNRNAATATSSFDLARAPNAASSSRSLTDGCITRLGHSAISNCAQPKHFSNTAGLHSRTPPPSRMTSNIASTTASTGKSSRKHFAAPLKCAFADSALCLISPSTSSKQCSAPLSSTGTNCFKPRAGPPPTPPPPTAPDLASAASAATAAAAATPPATREESELARKWRKLVRPGTATSPCGASARGEASGSSGKPTVRSILHCSCTNSSSQSNAVSRT